MGAVGRMVRDGGMAGAVGCCEFCHRAALIAWPARMADAVVWSWPSAGGALGTKTVLVLVWPGLSNVLGFVALAKLAPEVAAKLKHKKKLPNLDRIVTPFFDICWP